MQTFEIGGSLQLSFLPPAPCRRERIAELWAAGVKAEAIRDLVCLADVKTVFYHLGALRLANDPRAARRRQLRIAA